jgi:hypothetical protein
MNAPLEDLHRAQALIASWKNDVHTKRDDLTEAKAIMDQYCGHYIRCAYSSLGEWQGELMEVITDVAGLRLRFPALYSFQPFVHRLVRFEILR